jgi:K+-sensing histidine kinase KdpD
LRDRIENTNAALVLVLIVVAAAATGPRWAAIIAALSSSVWFDFFLTRPYQRFSITSQADIETAVLLTLVGLAVTEVALWGRRQQARASQQAGYLQGVVQTAGLVAAGSSRIETLISHVADQLVDVLGLDDCQFGTDTRDGAPAAIVRDGAVVRRAATSTSNATDYPPTARSNYGSSTTASPAAASSSSPPPVARPSTAQCQVAVAFADQIGAALATDATPH